MKHYLDLIPVFSRIHRRQNRMSVFCIVLSVFLVTSIFGMADMYIRSQILQTQWDYGNYHIGIKDITEEEAYLISRRPEIKSSARYGVLNYRGDEGYDLCGKSIILMGCDEEWMTQMQVDAVTEGNFPKSGREIMLTQSAKDLLGIQVGDQVTPEGPQGVFPQYTVSGFLRNTAVSASEDVWGAVLTYEAFCEIYPTDPENKGGSLTDYNALLCVRFKDDAGLQNTIQKLKEQCGLADEQIMENTRLMALLGQSASSFVTQVYFSAGILFLLVLVTGVMMITASLNSNVAQRTEFFGLMRCVGATPKQIMKMVRKEALGWCRFAVPVGVLSGMILIWVLCAGLRTAIPEYFSAIPLFQISLPSVLAGTALGLLTVFLAARSPAKRAACVSPLTAVSGNASGLLPVKKAASTRFFPVEYALGIHHAKASRKNYVLMTLSFALSIILFLCFSVSITFLKHTFTPLQPWTADLSIISPDQSCSVERQLSQELQEDPAVKTVFGRMFSYSVPAVLNGQELKIDLISYEEHQFSWAEDYLLEGSASAAWKEPGTGLLVYETGNAGSVGDTVSIEINGKRVQIQISGILSDSPFASKEGSGTVICSEETFRSITGQQDYTILDVQLNPSASDEDVTRIRKMIGTEYTFSDERLGNSSVRSVYVCMKLFVYGFLVLIVFITIFNIMNSIAMSVEARTRQYGAFRAIGLSVRQMKAMVMAEALTYGVTGTIAGVTLGLLLHWQLFRRMVSYNWGDPWTIPWGELAVIVLVVLLSVILSVAGPIQRLKSLSVVSTLHA
ncbi:MAG TPA: FtsX-like permease family protein [Candidatus Choladousia intestinigallinarum]|nr:FtsX-like permease family protein [Candidatus Choladousia intestinigallinarum]